MSQQNIYNTFVVYDQSFPISLTTDDLFDSKEKAEAYASEHNKAYESNRFFKPSLVSTLDDYIYKVKNDARSEGESNGRDMSRRELDGE